jgi:hypothetical protein
VRACGACGVLGAFLLFGFGGAGKFGRSRITRRSFIFGQIPEWAASGALAAATIDTYPTLFF